jgi:hypothetical protein
MMPTQPSLFATRPSWPEGFRYQPDLISPTDERALLQHMVELAFSEFEFKGYVGKRRTISFGWRYDFSQEKLQVAKAIPALQRASLTLEPRSAYLLDGPARTGWEHSIPPVSSLRYSVTFRRLRSERA